MAVRRDRIVGAGYPFLVAALEARVVGYAYVAAFRDRPAFAATVEDSIYLDPAAAGRGIGKLLLSALIARAEQSGHRRMLAVIGDSANLASIRLHAACGFTDAGRFDAVGWKADRWLDVVLMQRPLGLGSDAPMGPRA
jgi:phosphinothricin acetyltransferase